MRTSWISRKVGILEKEDWPRKEGVWPPLPTMVIFSCSHCFCTIFVLILYSLDTQLMAISILIDIQYSQKADFSFEKDLNHQNYSSSGSHHLVKNPLFPNKISDSPEWGGGFTVHFWKILKMGIFVLVKKIHWCLG